MARKDKKGRKREGVKTRPRVSAVFDSLSAFGSRVRSLHIANGGYDSSYAGSDKHASSWYGRMTLDETLNTLERGGSWDEVSNHISPVNLDSELDAHNMPAPIMVHAVNGFMPDVPLYLTGCTPEYMTQMSEIDTPNKLLKIGVTIVRPAAISYADCIVQARSLISVIDALESREFSVELWGVYRMTDRDAEKEISIEICIKRSDEHWSPESVAFALGHIAMSRRAMFRLVELTPDMRFIISSGYGAPTGEPDASDYDVWLGYTYGGRAAYDESTSLAWHLGQIVEGIGRMELRTSGV